MAYTFTIVSLLQIILALGLINVWIVQFDKPTSYRGKGAANMKQEFAAYGLPVWFMYLVGAAKLVIAGLLVVGLWISSVVAPAALVLGVLMLGAIAMHVKVRDSFKRTAPAVAMLAMVVVVLMGV
jgi:hypothetical protein